MSEELEKHNDGTWSGLVKTLVGAATTIVSAGGIWLSTHLFKGEDDAKDEAKTEQVAQPAAAPVVVNVQQNQSNVQQQKAAAPVVVKERVIEKSAPAPAAEPKPAAPAKKEYESW